MNKLKNLVCYSEFHVSLDDHLFGRSSLWTISLDDQKILSTLHKVNIETDCILYIYIYIYIYEYVNM